MRQRIGQIQPRYLGALLGIALSTVLYVVDAALKAGGSDGIGVYWLILFVLPGVAAAAVARKRGTLQEAEPEGALAGLITAHFVAALILVALVEGVLGIDWAQYATQAGQQVAGEVKAAIVPATAIAGVASLALIYGGCVAASWLGAAGYSAYAGIVGHETPGPQANV
jgi:hypothetical protein